jgi:hypothetical protein
MPFDLPATKDFIISWVSNLFTISVQGRIQDFKLGGRDFSHEIPQIFSHLPPQLEKIWFFGVKSWFFHTKYPNNFRGGGGGAPGAPPSGSAPGVADEG